MAVACLASSAMQATPRSKPVTVVNDPAAPVPVKGAVTVESDDANPVFVRGVVTVESDDVNPVFVRGEVNAVLKGTPHFTVDNDAANPVPVTLSEPVQINMGTKYRFRGTSTFSFLPNVGLNGMNAVCRSDFGIDARMCTTKEFFQTPDTTSFTRNRAWIKPHYELSYIVPGTNSVFFVDYSGGGWGGSPAFGDCDMFTSSSSALTGATITMPVVGAAQTAIFAACDDNLPVSCCTPQ